MTIYKPSDKLRYGKNKGFQLEIIYKYQPSYIEWAIINIADFCIDIDAFEGLDDPTTIRYRKEQFDISRKNKTNLTEMSDVEISKLLRSSDELNHMVDVSFIIDEVKLGNFDLTRLTDFKFPEHIRAINAYKIFIANT